MLSDDDYQSIKVAMLTAADTANRIANSNQTVYYDEEAYARVYEALTTLKSNCVRLFSELDLFRAMFREQVADQLRSLMGEQSDDAGNSDGGVPEVQVGGAAVGTGEGDGGQPASAVDAVEATGSEPPPKKRRPYTRRNKKGVSGTETPVDPGNGGSEMGGASAN